MKKPKMQKSIVCYFPSKIERGIKIEIYMLFFCNTHKDKPENNEINLHGVGRRDGDTVNVYILKSTSLGTTFKTKLPLV